MVAAVPRRRRRLAVMEFEKGGERGPSSPLLLPPRTPGPARSRRGPSTAEFVPGTGGASVLLAGVGGEEEEERSSSSGSTARSREGRADGKRRGTESRRRRGRQPGLHRPSEARGRPLDPRRDVGGPPVAAEKRGGGKRERERKAALLSVSPEGATALVRSNGGGLFALDLNSFSSPPRALSASSFSDCRGGLLADGGVRRDRGLLGERRRPARGGRGGVALLPFRL